MQMNREQQIYRRIWAPVIMDFAWWTLQEAVRSGKERLYFLARDGYQAYLAASTMAEWQHLPVECRYLEGSRYAWRLPENHLLGKKAIARLCAGGIDVSLRKILQRGGLTAEDISEIAESLCMTEALDQRLTYAQVKALKPVLCESERLLSMIRHHSVEAYQTTIAYFQQEGLFDHIPCAIVDSGWTGSMQQTLAHLLRSAAPEREHQTEGYYFGLYELPPEADRRRYHTFFFVPYGDIRRKARFSNCLFEAVFSEPRGMTIGYERKNGRLISLRETAENPNAGRIRRNITLLKEALEEAAGTYIVDTKTNVDGSVSEGKRKKKDRCREDPDIRKHLSRLQRLMSHPSPEEAGCLGTYLFSDDVWSTSLQQVAQPLTGEEIRGHHVITRFLLMTGIGRGALKDSAWIEGSVVNFGRGICRHLWNVRLYKYLIYVRKRLKAMK